MLREVTLRLCREAMVMAGWDGPRADEALALALADGSAKTRWTAMVEAHGGDPDPERLARPRAIREVAAPAAGFIRGCAADELGRVAAEAGAGRRTVDDELAHGAGVLVHVRLGDRVETGQPLASLLVGERGIDEEQLLRRLLGAWEIGPEPVEPPQLILGTVDDVEES
jgi:thymidine phosphorylase